MPQALPGLPLWGPLPPCPPAASRGSAPSCPVLRALPSGIFGITQPFLAWLLASSLPPSLAAWLSGEAQPLPPSTQHQGRGRRQLRAGVPAPPTATPTPAQLARPLGRQMFHGGGSPGPTASSPWRGGAAPRVFLDGVEGGVERGRKGGAVGLVLSSKRNLRNVAILGRLEVRGLDLGGKTYIP